MLRAPSNRKPAIIDDIEWPRGRTRRASVHRFLDTVRWCGAQDSCAWVGVDKRSGADDVIRPGQWFGAPLFCTVDTPAWDWLTAIATVA